jgi:2-polyprenyl-6-methoxyphenol hydroxylase-like FAD-dependent oxidoreductase
MRTVIVGAGPTGLFTAIALARRGRDVVVVDRDPGPGDDGSWRRSGVMQFDHAHTFRGPVVDALRAEVPDALRAVLQAGATIASGPDGAPVALRSRRAVLERALRDIAAREPRLRLLTGHVDGVVSEGKRAVGVDVGGTRLSADLVIDASGRASRVMRGLRGAAEGGPCGAAYVSRQYQLAAAAEPGPVNSPIGLSLSMRGYFAVMFTHDARNFSITITHDGADRRMHLLRHRTVFETAVRTIPLLADWIDPTRARPVTPVLPGGRLYNSYRGQRDDDGHVVPGLVAVGDSVCTTTPLAGRGVTLGYRQAQALVELLVAHGDDTRAATEEFDHWCTAHVRPWFLDHVHCDGDRLRRWAGGDVELDSLLPSDMVVAAARADAALRAGVAAYDRMAALPSSLDGLQSRARAVYASGWRPPIDAGPDRDELAALCQDVSRGRDLAVAVG